MKIVVTGGTGFVGYHVAKQILQSTYHSLIIIDNLNL
jgi:nucleoside-diphosphate-sugar epimerase